MTLKRMQEAHHASLEELASVVRDGWNSACSLDEIWSEVACIMGVGICLHKAWCKEDTTMQIRTIGKPSIDHVLSQIVQRYETQFPGRIRACYLTGSYARCQRG